MKNMRIKALLISLPLLLTSFLEDAPLPPPKLQADKEVNNNGREISNALILMCFIDIPPMNSYVTF